MLEMLMVIAIPWFIAVLFKKHGQFSIAILMTLSSSLAHSAENPVTTGSLVLDHSLENQDVPLNIFKDRQDSWGAHDILMQAFQHFEPTLKKSFFIDRESLWVKFDIENPSEQAMERILEVSYPRMRNTSVYIIALDKVRPPLALHSAIEAPKAFVNNYTENFLLRIGPQSKTSVLVKFPSYTFISKIGLQVFSVGYFSAKNTSLKAMYCFYLGIILSILFYNLFLFSALREKIFAFYCLTILFGHGFTLAAYFGISTEFLWPDSNFMHFRSFYFFCSMLVASSLIFVDSYLSLPQHAPRHSRIFRIGAVLVALLSPASFFHWSQVIPLYGNGILVVCVLAIFEIASLQAIAGRREARFFLIAWLPLLIGSLTAVAHSLALIKTNNLLFGQFFLLSSCAVEAMLLSIALGDRFNQIKKDKYRELKKRMHAHDQLLKLVYPHMAVRINEGADLESTMPCRWTEACVISFDVVGSSKINHPRFHDAIEGIMSKCQEIMLENYDQKLLVANAYRIKDLGDGFLCSLGFPFAVPQGWTPETLAVNLAERFNKVFVEHMSALKYHTEIKCAIGIAKGSIEGFFPSAGTRQYDLRGQAITLAKRYESMRNSVYQLIPSSRGQSILFIQNQVYEALLDSQKQAFSQWDATLPEGGIRDDHDASHAYFCLLPASAPCLQTLKDVS